MDDPACGGRVTRMILSALAAWALLPAAGGGEEIVLQQGVSPPGYAGCMDVTITKTAAAPTGRQPTLALSGTANRLLLRFDLPDRLKGKPSDSAELHLYFPEISGFDITHVEFACSRMLTAWNERAFFGLTKSSDAYEVALGRGTCYIRMGQPKEAIRILEVTLDRADPSHLRSIRSLLERLKEAYSSMQAPVPERWRNVAARVNLSLSQDTTPKRPSRMGLTALLGRSVKSLRSP